MTESVITWACPACGYVPVDEGERARHEQGVDDRHLECAHQDIDAIKAQQQASERGLLFGKVWG
jgi:hypothetical protein